jgi:hypothetical protein
VAADRHKYIQARIRDIFSQGAVAIQNMGLDRKFISGLVLGAGATNRFGQPKQLLPFSGGALLGWGINQEDKADADSVIRISAHIANHNISRVFSILR